MKQTGTLAPEVLITEHGNELVTDLVKWNTRETPVEIRFEDDDEDQ